MLIWGLKQIKQLIKVTSPLFRAAIRFKVKSVGHDTNNTQDLRPCKSAGDL